MPPRRGHSKQESKENQLQKDQDSTVAFVLCHPYANTMSPINGELPPCLWPLCNSPVLLYVLNWLSVNGIDKIYILCRKQDEKCIQKVTAQCSSRMLMENIKIISTQEPANSVGDCFRIISKINQERNLFKNCVVVPGTLATNIQLAPIIQEHIKHVNQSTQDLTTTLTAVFTQSTNGGYSIIEDDDHLILQIQPPSEYDFNISPPSLNINPDLFKKASRLRLRTGLSDSQIYIATDQCFLDIEDTFDIYSIVDQFIPNQLGSFSFVGHRSRIAYAGDAFAQTIDDLPDYISTSLAVIRRWLYPVTVEMNFFAPYEANSLANDIDFGDEDIDMEEDDEKENSKLIVPESFSADECTSYRLKRDLVYLYDNVFPSLTSKIGHSVVIGSGTQVSDNVVIKNSVIGSGCVIGRGAVIENCIIWDHVNIGPEAHLQNCLIASDATVNEKVIIQFGCIVSFNCRVASDLPRCRRLTTQDGLLPNGLFNTGAEDMGDFSGIEPRRWLVDYVENKELLFPDGNADENDQTFEFIPTPLHELPLLRMWNELSRNDFPIDDMTILDEDAGDGDFDFVEEDNEEEDIEIGKAEGDGDDDEIVPLAPEFQETAHALIEAVLSRPDFTVDELRPEFVSCKNSHNASNLECSAALYRAIIDFYPLDGVDEALDLFSDLILQFLDVEDGSEDNMVDLLFFLQQYCARDLAARKDKFVKVVKKSIEDDIITQSAGDEWAEQQDDLTKNQMELYEAVSDIPNLFSK